MPIILGTQKGEIKMNCKNCGALLDVNDNFCGMCGANVSNKSDTIKCNNCGYEFEKEWGICPMCGTVISTQENR